MAEFAADPGDPDALGTVRLAMRQLLQTDAAMLAEFRQLLAERPASTVTQHISAVGNAYVAGRDMHINR